MKLRKDDHVKVIAGAHKGQTGKIVAVHPAQNAVSIEGLGLVKRHIKPSQVNPRGGTKEVHVPIDASKVALIIDEKSGKTTRIGTAQAKDGKKTRIAKATGKEIK